MSSSRAGSRPTSDGFSARTVAIADSPPPPISPSPTRPLSLSISTIVRTNRPQWHPFAWRSGASRGTVTVVARTSVIFMGSALCIIPDDYSIAAGRGRARAGVARERAHPNRVKYLLPVRFSWSTT